MRPFVRFLLWLLIAALPLQGQAVASMRCGDGMPGHQGLPAARTAQTGASAEHQALGHEEHCPPVADESPEGHDGCSHCAGCAAGASAPPRLPILTPDVPFASSHHAAGEAAMTPHIPTTPKRPPRLQA